MSDFKIKLVQSWEATDGTLFRHCDLDRAILYQKEIDNILNVEINFKKNLETIKQYITENHEIDNPEPFHEGKHGWDCKVKENPVGKCIYEYEYDQECCVYCGEPEERK